MANETLIKTKVVAAFIGRGNRKVVPSGDFYLATEDEFKKLRRARCLTHWVEPPEKEEALYLQNPLHTSEPPSGEPPVAAEDQPVEEAPKKKRRKKKAAAEVSPEELSEPSLHDIVNNENFPGN